MRSFGRKLASIGFARCERAAVAVEYCLIGGAMALAIVAGITGLTQGLTSAFATVAAAFPH